MTNPSGRSILSISIRRSSGLQPRSLISENTAQAWRRSYVRGYVENASHLQNQRWAIKPNKKKWHIWLSEWYDKKKKSQGCICTKSEGIPIMNCSNQASVINNFQSCRHFDRSNSHYPDILIFEGSSKPSEVWVHIHDISDGILLYNRFHLFPILNHSKMPYFLHHKKYHRHQNLKLYKGKQQINQDQESMAELNHLRLSCDLRNLQYLHGIPQS